MDSLKYLMHIVNLGKAQAASSFGEMTDAHDSVNGFLGLYYDLAVMELQKAGLPAPAVRNFAIDKALERMDLRLDCSDFAIPALFRMLREHRGTRLDEAEALKIVKSLINYKYWLDEPGEVKSCYFTENHQILYHSAEYLAGQMFPDTVFPNNGMTGSEHRAHATVFLRRWLNWRERFGFSEWLTQGYYMEDMLGLVDLMIYADEEDIRTRCRMLIDMLVFDLAVNHFEGHLPTTHGRVYTRFIIDPDYEDCSAVMALLFDRGCMDFVSNCAVMLAANGYTCPQAILAAAAAPQGIQTNRERMSLDVADARYYGVDPADFDNIMFFWGQQTYSDRLTVENSLKVFPTWNWMTNRVRAYYERYRLHDEAGSPCVDAPDYTAMTQADIYTRRTPDYILSCVQDFRKGRMGYQQHPWTASLGGKAVIFTTNPASPEYSNRPSRWAGNLTLPRAVQHENVLLCLYRIEPDFVDYLYSHLYFPVHEMDEVVEKDGWIFGRRGRGYAAVYSLLPGYWEKKDPELFKALYGENWQEKYDRARDYEYVAQGHANVWVIEMGSEAENGSFQAFMNRFEGRKVYGDTHHLVYDSPSQGEMTFGWTAPLTVGGKEISIHGYKRYDNAFAQTEFDADRIRIEAGGHRTVLDFKNAQRADL